MIIDGFEKLLEEEQSKILIDTSVLEMEETLRDKERFFTAKSFEDVDIDELEAFLQSVTRYINALQSDKIVVIPEVVSERERFKNSFVHHVNLMEHVRRPDTYRKREYHTSYRRMRIRFLPEEDMNTGYKKAKRSRAKKQQKSEQYIFFKEAVRNLKIVGNELNSHLLVVDDHLLYEDLKDLIIEMSTVKGIKKESYPKGRWVYEDLHTDEALVGTALYLAVRGGEPITIAHCDTDIPQLLQKTFDLFCLADYGLRERLCENPVNSCFLPYYNMLSTANLHPTDITLYGNAHQEGEYREKVRQVAIRLIGSELDVYH